MVGTYLFVQRFNIFYAKQGLGRITYGKSVVLFVEKKCFDYFYARKPFFGKMKIIFQVI